MIALWLGVSLAGLMVVGLAIVAGISSQINKGFVSEFSISEGQYSVETNLDPDNNSYYIVASVRGNTKRSRIVSAVVDIQSVGENKSEILEAGDSRSVHCEGIGYCNEQILKGFSIGENGVYRVLVGEFSTTDKIEILDLNLHSNHGVILQAVFIFTGLALLIVGIFLAVFSLAKIGCNRFVHIIKKISNFIFLKKNRE